MWSSNLSIIAASFNAAFFAKDAVEYTKNVTRYLHYILFALFVAVILLVIRYFHKDSKEGHNHVGEQNADFKNVNTQANVSKIENFERNNVFGHPIWKLTIGMVISSIVLLLISGVILYNSQVYYVVLRNNIPTEQEANDFVEKTNQLIKQKGLKNLKALRLYKGKKVDQYLVTINGGYLIQSEAESVKNLLIKNGFKTSTNPEVRPSGAAFLRKLVYLNQLFSNE